MPSIVNFDNKNVIEPGVRSRIIGGVTNPPVQDTFGVVTIIDTGSGAGFGGGSGINGELRQNSECVYSFDNITDSQKFLGGGLLYDLMNYLWTPSNGGNGPQKLNIIRACTTEAAKKTIIFGVTAAPVAEVRATLQYYFGVWDLGVDGDNYKVIVGESPLTGTVIGDYTKVTGDDTIAKIVTGIITSINTTDYDAAVIPGGGSNNNYFQIQAPTGSGFTLNGVQVWFQMNLADNNYNFTSYFHNGSPAIPEQIDSSVEIICRNEGLRGNGAKITNVSGQEILSRGYGFRVSAGVKNPDAFVITFYEGQYKGADANNIEYEIAEISCTNRQICKSIEFTTSKQFYDWAINDYTFNLYFEIPAGQEVSTGTLVPTFATDNPGWILFEGGTETYNALDVDAVLESIIDLDNDLFLCDKFGADAQSVQNTKILAYMKQTSTFTQKIMFVGGGQDKGEFQDSLDAAAYFNDELAVVVHSAIKAPLTIPTGGLPYRELSSLYHAAMVCGRTAGLQPQVPVTYKDLRIKGLKHELSKTERETALRGGVLHTKFVSKMGWVVNQGINTLQLNDYLVYPDGGSPEIQVMRIEHQLNKEIIINATPLFVGGNRNTVSPEDIKLFIEGLLQGRTATTQDDNLIISSQNVSVVLKGTDYETRYCFIVNSPINRLFSTGVILDPNISI